MFKKKKYYEKSCERKSFFNIVLNYSCYKKKLSVATEYMYLENMSKYLK